jgi:membrane protein
LLIDNAQPQPASTTSTLVGLAAMIFAATGVFTELKDSLNTIWEVQPRPGLGLFEMVRHRFFAFAMVLVIWFLMLVSLIASAAMSALNQYALSELVGFHFLESLLSLTLVTLLFALIYRVLPDVLVAWRDVWFGALTTAILFVVGKTLFGLYLGHSSIGNELRGCRITGDCYPVDVLFLSDLVAWSGDDAGPGRASSRCTSAQ